ncbi:MAG TPA: MBL fold metallo-hydrolase [Burkholderiales bacterium]|nr:MBL fold metallo-hydrolase [Burkholderiales bacterium]
MKLPASVQVLERGWLSSNSIVLRDGDAASVIDSGYGAHAEQTLALLAHALRGDRLERLVNTHCHSDHMGGNAAIRRAHACRIGIPAGEAPLIDDWDEQALVLAFADQRAERFAYDEVFRAGDVLRMGGLDWRVLAAPGHDPHAVMFHAPEARVLVSGDALWENGFGVVFPRLFGDERALAETRATLETIAALELDVVVPGHGRPFGEVQAALGRALERVAYYEADLGRLARHCVKVLLAFTLLEKRALALDGLAAYLERVPVYREINRRHLGMAPAALAAWLASELERAGVARRSGGLLHAASG